MNQTIRNMVREYTIPIVYIATVVGAFMFGIPDGPARTQVEYQESNYFVTQDEKKQTTAMFERGAIDISLIDSDNNGHVDRVSEKLSILAGKGYWPISSITFRNPTESEQEIFEGIFSIK